MQQHTVVSHEAWIEARKQLLAKEKEFTRLRDELSQQRRDLPWERVEKNYVFEGPHGKTTLADLFGNNSQLIVYHFMFDPDWDMGCKSCSWWADNLERNVIHLAHRDVAVATISRAPLAKIEAFKKRLGWTIPWVSSNGDDFNFDYGVSFRREDVANGKATYNYRPTTTSMNELPGISIFYKDPSGGIFHTYSCYSRGLDMMNAAYHYLDLVPKGRDEGTTGQAWVRHRDNYGT